MKRTWLVLTALVVLVLCIGLMFLFLHTRSGLNILFEFHDKNNYPGNRVGGPILPKGVVYVEVYAITPPTYKVPEVKIWNGTLTEPYLFIPYSGEFKRIVDDFYEYLKSSSMFDEIRVSARYGLRIDLWIFFDNGTVISDTRYVTYSPWLIRGGNEISRVVEVDLTYPMLKYDLIKNVNDILGREQVVKNTTAFSCTWLREWSITPDELAGNGAPYTIVNGIWYIETPVLIIDNSHYYSGILLSSIEVSARYPYAALTVSIGLGRNMSSNVNSYPYNISRLNVTLYESGYSVEKNGYLIDASSVPPNETIYYFMYTRPYVVFEKEACYYGNSTRMLTGNERIRVFVTEFLANGSRIIGSFRKGWPSSIDYDVLHNNSSSVVEQIMIPGDSVLGDGGLDVGEAASYLKIYNYYDTCASGFEAPIPIGPIAAKTCIALTGSSCSSFTTLLASIPIVLKADPKDSVIVWGGLKNCGNGTVCGIHGSKGYNVIAILYTRFIRLEYRVYNRMKGYCGQPIPIALYFKVNPITR